MMTTATQQHIYSVSKLNREVRVLLENNFLTVWLEGEISNFVIPQSGHWYFSLKDSSAQIRAAMFKPLNQSTSFIPKEGMQVLVRARVSLYEGRGDFQLIVEYLEEAGIGKLRKAFELLKKQLADKGFFDTAKKKPLPPLPYCIGIITSPTGAAIQDILAVLKRRFSCIPIIVYPTLVQGAEAPASIVEKIELANQQRYCDVLIIARGGGSLEDLWAFNDEKVAHAIYNSAIPIITGIGHEIDFTIADFVADVRAATPSAAAELVAPHQQRFIDQLASAKAYFIRHITQQLQQQTQSLQWLQKHLEQQHPKRRIQDRVQQLDLFEIKLHHLHFSLLKEKNQQLNTLAAKLNTLSPLATLSRGYALAKRDRDQHILLEAQQINVGEKIIVTLSKGELSCTVNSRIFEQK